MLLLQVSLNAFILNSNVTPLLTTSYPTLQLIYFRRYFRSASAFACPSANPSASFSWIFHNAKL